MAVHLHRDLGQLKKELLLLGSMVEQATRKAMVALIDRRAGLAEEVIAGDEEVDEREVQVEEECLKILALHQPVANDLRFVVTAMKVNNDLERVGDLAGNVAERARFLAGRNAVEVPPELVDMAERVRVMLRESLNAMIDSDTELARKVLREDEEVDDLHRTLYKLFQRRMQEQPEQIENDIHLLSVSRYLERIADLATNIAEDVVFLVEGEVVRHRVWTG